MATYGVRVRDAGGVPILDSSTRAGVLWATVSTNAANGSFVVPAHIPGAVFAGVTQYNAREYYFCEPTVTVSGRTVTWVYNRRSWQTNVNATLLIGVF